MLRRYSTNFVVFSLVLDLSSIFSSLALALRFRFAPNTFPDIVSPNYQTHIPPLLFFVLPFCWIMINLGSGLYEIDSNILFVEELSKLIYSTLVAVCSMAGVLYFFQWDTSRTRFITFVAGAFCWMLLWRIMVRIYWRIRDMDTNKKKQVLVIGAGKVGYQVATAIQKYSINHMHFVGFLDDDPDISNNPSDVLGPISSLDSLLKTKQIDHIVIALTNKSRDSIVKIVDLLLKSAIRVWIVPDEYRFTISRTNLEMFAGIPMLDLRPPAFSNGQRLSKRIFDVVFVTFSLPIVAPLLVLISAAIKLISPGPIFFRQKRVGEGGKLFEMYKFRTMIVGAESMHPLIGKSDGNGNTIYKTPDDPRITPIGRILRRYSMDELPQIINIIKGEISVVGPRPELPSLVEKYNSWQTARFNVPQGLTGWWQVNGRSDKPMHLNTQDDLYYIENYSFWLDIKIIIRTTLVVLLGKGAY